MKPFIKRLLGSAAVGALAVGAVAPLAMADVDINVAIKGVAPGVYGRVDLGGRPPPRLVYEKPVVIERPHGVVGEPVYLHVPPDHARHWKKWCHEYHACNRPVYFVRSEEYEPGYHRR